MFKYCVQMNSSVFLKREKAPNPSTSSYFQTCECTVNTERSIQIKTWKMDQICSDFIFTSCKINTFDHFIHVFTCLNWNRRCCGPTALVCLEIKAFTRILSFIHYFKHTLVILNTTVHVRCSKNSENCWNV